MAEQYDNTNRGSGWTARAVSGHLDVAGTKYWAAMVATGSTVEKAPAAMLFLTHKDNPAIIVPLWKSEPDKKHILHGKLVTPDRKEFWCNVFKVDRQGDRVPAVDFSLQPVQSKTDDAGGAVPPPSGDAIPF